MLSLMGGGCMEEHIVRDTWGNFARDVGVAKPSVSQGARMEALTPLRGAGAALTLDQPNWAILLRKFTGRKAEQEAEQLVQRLQRETNMPDLWIGQLKDGWCVYRGRYLDRGGLDTLSDLRQTHMTRLDGKRPFENAQLERVDELLRRAAGLGTNNEMDLRAFFNQGLWSLQIAVYDADFGEDYPKAAETAATELRKDGHQAYFYHGPHRSMVTVGLLTYEQAWERQQIGQQDTYSAATRALREQFPYNLLNGRTIIEKSKGQVLGEQPSALVKLAR